MVIRLVPYWQQRGFFTEGRQWLALGLDLAGSDALAGQELLHQRRESRALRMDDFEVAPSVGFTDVSPYLLDLTVAASLLVPTSARSNPT